MRESRNEEKKTRRIGYTRGHQSLLVTLSMSISLFIRSLKTRRGTTQETQHAPRRAHAHIYTHAHACSFYSGVLSASHVHLHARADRERFAQKMRMRTRTTIREDSLECACAGNRFVT